MLISKTLKFYKRKDIQEELLKHAEDREIAVRFGERGFGKRPDALHYISDIMEFAKRGASSFHCSEERWINPQQIGTDFKQEEKDDMRKGWDLVLDIDCKLIEYSKIAAYYTIKVLKHYGIKSITCKFSGNKGFHIAVPFEAFPESIGGISSEKLFPEAPRKIASYIKYLIKDPVSDAILKLEKNNLARIIAKTGKKAEEITRIEMNEYKDKVEKLNAEPFLDIDTMLISSRHLFRMPYSFHEKSELVSIPISTDKVLSFKKKDAKSENIVVGIPFLNRDAIPNEAGNLVIQAFDFEVKTSFEDKQKREIKYEEFTEAIPEQLFPPCIHNIFKGMGDGKKRAVFILSNFLSSVGWSHEQITERINEWNKKNTEALRQVYINGQLRYKTRRNAKVLPPNCDNKGYYKDLLLCTPDTFCSKIRNPVQYAKVKAKQVSREKKSSPKKKE